MAEFLRFAILRDEEFKDDENNHPEGNNLKDYDICINRENHHVCRDVGCLLLPSGTKKSHLGSQAKEHLLHNGGGGGLLCDKW